jgi:hypothetical protein
MEGAASAGDAITKQSYKKGKNSSEGGHSII